MGQSFHIISSFSFDKLLFLEPFLLTWNYYYNEQLLLSVIGQKGSVLCLKRTNFGWYRSTCSLVWGWGNHEWMNQWTVTNDPNNLEPLTLNYLPQLKPNPIMPPGLFQREHLFTEKVETGARPCLPVLEKMDKGIPSTATGRAQME